MIERSNRRAAFALLTCLVTCLSACGEAGNLEVVDEAQSSDDDPIIVSALTSQQRRSRSDIIKRAAAEKGISNAVLLAGIANGETHMAHCWSEATWACKGPASSSCGGGPVIAGSGDGPCRIKQGGLGYFQFDAGTHSQTLNRYGNDVLTVEGSTHEAVEFVIAMVIRSRYVSGVSNRAQAVNWINSVRVDGHQWSNWIATVVHYYNGCVPGRCSKHSQRTRHYSENTRAIYREFGNEFWFNTPAEPAQPPATPSDLRPEVASLDTNDSILFEWSGPRTSTFDIDAQYWQDGAWRAYWTWTDKSGTAFRMWPQIDDTLYRWRVRECQSNTCSEWSEFKRFTYGAADLGEAEPEPTPAPTPEPEQPSLHAPGGMSPVGGTISRPSAELTWSAVEVATHYDIDMQYKSSRGVWTDYWTWTERAESSFTVWPQQDNTTYRWRVRACDGSECSSYSNFEEFFFTGK